MTAHNSRNSSNNRIENNMTVNTVGTPSKAGMLAKVVKPSTACSEATNSRDTINIRDHNISRDNMNIMDVKSFRTAQIRKVKPQ
jgi:hypothetical protein